MSANQTLVAMELLARIIREHMSVFVNQATRGSTVSMMLMNATRSHASMEEHASTSSTALAVSALMEQADSSVKTMWMTVPPTLAPRNLAV